MATIDIRNGKKDSVVTKIVATDDIFLSDEHNSFYIEDSDSGVEVHTKKDALNIIKAIKKAIELGWVK